MRISRNPLDYLIPVFVILVFATKLRLGTFPIGPGEIGLFLFVLVCFKGFVFDPIGSIKNCHSDVQMFWYISGLSALIGLLFFHENSGLPYNHREIVAFLFSAILTFCFFQLSWSKHNVSKALESFGVLSCTTTAALFLAHAIIHTSQPMLFTYGSGARFSGLSQNPNQLALLLSVAPFAFLVFVKSSLQAPVGWTKKAIFYSSFILTLTAGYFTYSSALLVAWLIGLLTLILGYFLFKKSSEEIKIVKNFLLISFCFSLILIFIFSFQLPLFKADLSQSLADILYRNASYEMDGWIIRLALLKNGFEAILTSPFFGYGPGAYSGVVTPFEGSESHNSFIDWTLCSGLIGGVALLFLITKVLHNLKSLGEIELISCLIAMGTFAQFHYVFRQPMVWFLVFLLVSMSYCEDKREKP